MPHTVNHDPVLNIVEVILTRLITEADLREGTTQAISMQRQTGTTSYLVDIKGWDVSASFADIFEVVNTLYWKEEANRQSCIALVFPTSLSAQEAARFYETVSLNRGWNVRLCSDRQSAIDWLRNR